MEGHWVQLKEDSDYEIYSEFPHPIRRIGEDKPIAFTQHKYSNYLVCKLNGRQYRVHRIIANNFIKNPNNYDEVDHLNHDRADYRISNLRWCTRFENNRNRSSMNGIPYEFVDKLDENAIPITSVNDYDFEDYYYCDGKILLFVGDLYKKAHQHPIAKQWKVHMTDVNNKSHSITKYQIEKALNITIE